MAGVMRTNGAVTREGIRPRGTIGSEKTIRISFTSVSAATSPSGPALRTRSGWAGVVCAARKLDAARQRVSRTKGRKRNGRIMSAPDV